MKLEEILGAPCGTLLTTYKKVTGDAFISAQEFWKETKAPDTDLYIVHNDDAKRIELLRQVVKHPRMSDIDTRLAQRLSASWDNVETAANFEADLIFDLLRRDCMSLFLELTENATTTRPPSEGIDPLGSEGAMIRILSLVERLNLFKRESILATKSKVAERYKSGLAQLSSLAGFPLHMGLAPLEASVAKVTALLPSDLQDLT